MHQDTSSYKEDSKDESKNTGLGAICHVLGFCAFIFPLGNVWAPLAFWLWKKKENTTVDCYGKEVINFQISFVIYCIAFAIFGAGMFGLSLITTLEFFLLVAFFALAILGSAWLFLMIFAALKASNGEKYRYPFTIRFLK